jgi:GNAT superfamily N-acetyltransferase
MTVAAVDAGVASAVAGPPEGAGIGPLACGPHARHAAAIGPRQRTRGACPARLEPVAGVDDALRRVTGGETVPRRCVTGCSARNHALDWRAVEPTFRIATPDDVPAMMEIRNAVVENRLVSTVLTVDDYVRAITVDGRAWVCEVDGSIVGFVCGRLAQRDIWALFMRASHEGRGIGSALMDIVETWMFEAGLDEIGLSTAAGTRAERLYVRRGWQFQDARSPVEVEYRLDRERAAGRSRDARSP